ncbi:MAG TPA: type I glyceraldehyde-3-phosphate dehydrogenase [Candidatus Magasanikbacteria bacterium]|nr:MAG: type I glyceraldehyde-3-phosphate dehydrogenase [Candidatus Magasanikbacteria bacterium RIFCSPLOWO2_02_FULL_47_16]OGH79257.1 MAG: type I glyceraldehyde-3-phosphate dehydrogenase [Candidatus Magasanikbacteria bacterium RIFCSPHIGHO2_02_FULL_48_18]OGH83056.1 MAG: type I glyceraldehyde-3-phosphate dehydrogenase [Candidatus Magasanikbacteria bacterium RIFCSPLOWO2_12_FULL_47_9b]HAZ28350.1 type I glyceraldehyde-3-phosphate dehydrogenase [Candidatus Magasanikbacteria bacterium]
MIRIAINGFGRIGRHALKVALQKKNVQIVAINDLTDTKTLAHLLKYDTAYPDITARVTFDQKNIIVNGKKITIFCEKDPVALPWKKMKIDVVIESTGRFTNEAGAGLHLKAGAKKVVISAPAKGGSIATYVRGVNDKTYDGAAIIDNASCTTNCTAPVMLVLEKEFGVAKAMLTTIHAYTADQNLQDGPHKDLRRARAAAENIVPTSTGAAIATAKVIPSLKGKFDGLAIRVPVVTVSLSDMTVLLKKNATIDAVNNAMKKAEKTYLKGILATTDEPLVSSDFIGNSFSSIVDLPLTNVVDGNLVKVIAWYDNEWGYANRLVEMVMMAGRT